MAANSQQFGAISEPNRRVHEVNNVSIENRLDQLTNIVTSLVTGKINPARACGICTMTDHPTDCCPSLQEETVNAIGNFPGPPQRPYNPYGNTYNPGWKCWDIIRKNELQWNNKNLCPTRDPCTITENRRKS
ncbi:hypothetical protein GQ457_04G005960 [Hibiscus cannabinus]